MSMPKRLSMLFLTVVLSGLLAACTGSLPPLGTAAYSRVEYSLAAGDKLKITVFGEESLTADYVVSSAGDLSFPLLGDLAVGGKTLTQLQTEIARQLGQGYLNDPRVSVEVLNYRPFYILGEVDRPGEYPFNYDLTVEQAVALAGGYSYRANTRKVFIRRADSDSEETYELGSSRRVFVAPGDTIRIGERYF